MTFLRLGKKFLIPLKFFSPKTSSLTRKIYAFPKLPIKEASLMEKEQI